MKKWKRRFWSLDVPIKAESTKPSINAVSSLSSKIFCRARGFMFEKQMKWV
jgi:hypothetical protein